MMSPEITRGDTAGAQRQERPPVYISGGYREHPARAALRRSLERHNRKKKKRPQIGRAHV